MGWKESLYLDVIVCNDWLLILVYIKYSSFFYFLVGLLWVLNNIVKFFEWIFFGKIRGFWFKVGNDFLLFISNMIFGSNDIIGVGGVIVIYFKVFFNDLKLEMSIFYEIGIEWRFFNYWFDFDIIYYCINIKN